MLKSIPGRYLLLYLLLLCTGVADAVENTGNKVSDIPTAINVAKPDNTAENEPDQALERDKVCTRCHDETDKPKVLPIYQTPHGVRGDARTPSCQSCHGESEAHVKNTGGDGKESDDDENRPKTEVIFSGPDKSSPEKLNDTCMSCHQAGLRVHWTSSQHETNGVVCTSCHTSHTPRDRVLDKTTTSQSEVCYNCHKTQRSEARLFSKHPLMFAKMACSSCHNPHGSNGPKMLVKNSVNETCYTCHAEKRGPFLWEHQPVIEDCSNCHTPHGSNNPPLLKTRTPWLCQECHSGDHSSQINSGANLDDGNVTTINGLNPLANAPSRAQLAGRNCQSCHVLVHGSNHPAGSSFLR
ncbi:MAG: DmsE family decaheme c-type cytochrome [Methyloglobulus sp.]|nr:DmsE family decaheme c-type cytochrome [Methyloglobulus sp.]